ncbi:hypothetical protein DM45_3391 [Burkholderia mallei]|nr:hypothetical protein DO73_4945 [Burkholderia pseudomallei]KOS76728.1 hypothetical protein DM46_2208 [Burkholderia mallei]KOS94086.1 hypothetical protein DM45_3391 [Burkholderia mallei]KOT23216.1 hypothetical protein DM52_2571 [Burkholderia mallei]
MMTSTAPHTHRIRAGPSVNYIHADSAWRCLRDI